MNGSVECLGEVRIGQPQHIVEPLTVEPTKTKTLSKYHVIIGLRM